MEVTTWYAGKVQRCWMHLYIAGFKPPKTVYRGIPGYYFDPETPEGPPEPIWHAALTPLEDDRPHWLTTPQRKPFKHYGKPVKATGNRRLRYFGGL